MFFINHVNEGFHGPVIQEPVIAEHRRKTRAGKLSAVQIVISGDDNVLRNADPVFLQSLHKAQRHFVVGTDKRLGKGKIILDPLGGNFRTVRGAPGFLQHLNVFGRYIVFPAGIQEPVQAGLAFRTVVLKITGQIYQAAGVMIPDDMVHNGFLGGTVVVVHQDASRQGAADGDGGNSRRVDLPDQIIPDLPEDHLIAENNRPVEGGQIRQVENPVFAFILVIAQVLAEAVKDPQDDIPVRIRVLLQAVKRLVDKLVIPVNGKIGDFVHSSGQGNETSFLSLQTSIFLLFYVQSGTLSNSPFSFTFQFRSVKIS